MVIDKIGSINNITESKKTKNINKAKDIKQGDSIQISSEGKKAADIAKVNQLVNQASDVRTERVKEIKAQIADGTYNFDNQKILELVADKIANALLR
jgi:flagellar biosynthesis anti-sigma factor FlgM